ECVEACPQPGAVFIRDSKQLDQADGYTVLSFSQGAWAAFAAHTAGR
ncbi:DUF397 domain-containing protein, partial [Streptomyces sp. NPDC097619]